jgi:hypothetical protein
MSRRYVVTFAAPMTAEATAAFGRMWDEAVTDRSKRALILGYPARLQEIDVPPRRSVRVKNAQRRLR